jgi:hypothetical protein
MQAPSLLPMHQQIFLSTIFFCLFYLTNSHAQACECRNISFTADSDNADLIFEGVAIDKRYNPEIGKVYYTFKLNKVWKGDHYQNVIIKTNNGGPACGAAFEIGKKYIVFATNFETTSCRRNSEVKDCADIPRLNYKYKLSYRQEIFGDTSAVISEFEAAYLKGLKNDLHFQNEIAGSINFAGKKIAFLDNNEFISKEDFFNRYGGKDVRLAFERILSDEIQGTDSYYGIIIMHRKMKITKRQKKKIMRQLQAAVPTVNL